jgi:hypothetical protein
LVFIAALTPDEGETVGEVFYREKPHQEAPQLAPDIHGLLWIPDERFGAAFCQDASPEQAALLAATLARSPCRVSSKRHRSRHGRQSLRGILLPRTIE